MMRMVIDGGRVRSARYYAMLNRARSIDLAGRVFWACAVGVSEGGLRGKE